MASKDDGILDLTAGFYRRLYSNFIWGKRINAISLDAEGWFWRIHSAVDDFGNMRADPDFILDKTRGLRRGVTIEQITAWLKEMEDRRLIQYYTHDLDQYLHVSEFTERQPAGRNGRRVRHVPASPWDDPNAGRVVSGGIQGNPRDSSAQEEHKHSQDHYKPPTEVSTAIATASTVDAEADGVLVFPVSAGKNCKDREWVLTRTHQAELIGVFQDVDVPAECIRALRWAMDNPKKRKTFDGMPAFLSRWLQNESRKRERRKTGPRRETPEEWAARVAGKGKPKQ